MPEQKTFKEIPVPIKVGTIITLMGMLVGFGIAWEKIQAKLSHLDSKTDLYAERWDSIEARVSLNEKQIELHYLEIITRLKGLEDDSQKIINELSGQ